MATIGSLATSSKPSGKRQLRRIRRSCRRALSLSVDILEMYTFFQTLQKREGARKDTFLCLISFGRFAFTASVSRIRKGLCTSARGNSVKDISVFKSFFERKSNCFNDCRFSHESIEAVQVLYPFTLIKFLRPDSRIVYTSLKSLSNYVLALRVCA